jgi:uncharacterized protein
MIEQIEQDFKNALKEKNEIVVSALRNLKAEIQNAEITKHDKLTADEVGKVVAKKVKQHKDSIDSFEKGGRPDLVENEKKQMEVLVKYLPKQMDESEVRTMVKQVVAELNPSANDFGRVMKEVMLRTKGQAEGNLVSGLVKEALSAKN